MLELNAEKLRDGALCRRLYHRKHVEGLIERKPKAARDQLVDEFEDSLIKTVKWFYFETMADKVPSFRSLQWKWEKLWFKGITAEQIMTEPTNPGKNRNTFNTEAQRILTKFYNTHKNPGDVLMINERYTIPLTPETKATGTLDLVLRIGGKIVLKHLGARGASSWNPGTLGWYSMILDSIAFRHLAGRPENLVSVDVLRDNKTLEFVITDADVNEVVALADAIDYEDKWLPTRGNYWCPSCNFKPECYPNQ